MQQMATYDEDGMEDSWSFHTTPDYESDLKDVKRIVESLFSFSPPLTVYLELNGKMSIQVHGTGLSILHQVYSYPIGEKTHNVRVPSKIFSLSPDLIAAFLRGVFDGDGCMGSYKVPNKRAYSLSCNFSSGSVLLIQQQEDVKNLANLLLSVSTGLLRKASQIQNALQTRLNYEMGELAEKVAKNGDDLKTVHRWGPRNKLLPRSWGLGPFSRCQLGALPKEPFA